jgi:hypothetical protein
MVINGSGDFSKVSKKELSYAIRWFGSMLMSKQMLKRITIDLKLRKERGMKGYALATDDLRLPRRFELCIAPYLSRNNQLRTAAHEMVHIKQFAKGELGVFALGSLQKWNREYWDHDTTDYWDHPWEIEAYGREEGLVHRYYEHLKTTGKKFDKP